MRRIVISLLATLVAVGMVSTAAWAKEAGVELSSTPFGTNPGDPWNPNIMVFLEGDQPATGKAPTLTVTNLGTGGKADYNGTPTGRPGEYSVEVIFPQAGRYSYEVYDPNTGRTYPFPPVRIVAPAVPEAPAAEASRPAVVPAGDSDSFPLWPVLGGALAALAAAGIGTRYVVTRRSKAAAALH